MTNQCKPCYLAKLDSDNKPSGSITMYNSSKLRMCDGLKIIAGKVFVQVVTSLAN